MMSHLSFLYGIAEYIPRLIAYQLKFEELVREREKGEK